jgi:hypothetical protein
LEQQEPTRQEERPMKSWPRAHWPLGVALVALIGLGILGLSTVHTRAQASLSRLQWQTYVSSKYGFSISFPPGWQVVETVPTVDPAIYEGVWFDHASLPVPGAVGNGARPDLVLIISFDDCMSDWAPYYFDHYMARPYQLGDVLASKITGLNKESQIEELVVVAHVDDICIQALPNGGAESLEYFDAILSTFRFPAAR